MSDCSNAGAWQAFLPEDVVWCDRPRSRSAARLLGRELSALPTGATVALASSGWRPGAANLLRRAHVVNRRAYLALPSLGQPLVVSPRSTSDLRFVSNALLTVPPGRSGFSSLLFTVGVRISRWPGVWRLGRILFRGQVVVGTRA